MPDTAQALRMRAEQLEQIIRWAPYETRDVLRRRRRDLEEVADRPEVRHLPEPAKAQAIEELRGPIRKRALDDYQAVLEKAKQAKTELDRLTNEHHRAERESDPASEIRKQRAWDRTKRRFDKLDGAELLLTVDRTVNELVRNGDRIALEAIREEIESYVQDRGLDPSTLKDQLVRLDVMTDPDGRGLGVAIASTVGKGYYRVERGLEILARSELEDKGQAVSLIGFDDEEILIEEPQSADEPPDLSAPVHGYPRIFEESS